jgi:hypothetical protein
MILNLNRYIMNLLTAVRTFLDHTERNLTHRHGKDSEQFQAFKKATAEAYDSSFAYRFLYKLRNYVQHRGMPIGKMSINTQLGAEPPPSMSQSLGSGDTGSGPGRPGGLRPQGSHRSVRALSGIRLVTS